MTTGILEKILLHSKTTKNIIRIRKYNDDDDFYIGYIVDYNSVLVVFQSITKYGLEDGLIVENISNIETFETEDDYLKSYQFLADNVHKIQKQTVKIINLPAEKQDNQNWQYELLKTKFDEGKMVAIELNNGNYLIHGYIITFDKHHLQLNLIDQLGNEDGQNIYKLDDISGLTIDRLESRKRQALFDFKRKI